MYRIRLKSDHERSLISVSLTGLYFNKGCGYKEFGTLEEAEEFFLKWASLTSWNWDRFEITSE